jgi:AraC family transcriptional regulator
MMTEIKETTEPMRYAYVEHIGPYPAIAAAFQKFFGIVGPAGLVKPDMQAIGRYYSDPREVPAEELRSHAGMFVGVDDVLPDGVEEGIIPAGKFFVYRHLGSYAGLPQAWENTMQSLPGAPRPEPPFEVYINDCTQVAEADLITDIYVPLS